MRRRLISVGRAAVLTVFAAGASLPILWTVLTSLKLPAQAFARPPKILFTPTLVNYARIFDYLPLARFMWNSLLIAAATTALSLIIGLVSAYSLVRFEFRFKSAFVKALLLTRTLPATATVIPLYLMFRNAGLLDSPLALILTYTAYNLGLVVWMLIAFVRDVPEDLEQAAMVDGASRPKAFFLVTVPLLAPGLAATGVFAFLAAWNEFLFALVFSSRNLTLPVAIASSITEVGVRWGEATAMASLALIPTAVIAVLFGRYMVQGLTMGAVK